MKRQSIAILFALFLATFPVCAQPVAVPAEASEHEELPELKASEIARLLFTKAGRRSRESVSSVSSKCKLTSDFFETR
jgi:hypothetical protein